MRALLNFLAYAGIALQLAENAFLFVFMIPGLRGNSFEYIFVPIALTAVSAILPCLFALIVHVLRAETLRHKALGLLIAVAIPIINLAPAKRMFNYIVDHQDISNFMLPLLGCVLLLFQIFLAWLAHRFLRRFSQHNHPMQPTSSAGG